MIIGRSQLSLAATTQRQITEDTATSTRIWRNGRQSDRGDAAASSATARTSAIADAVTILSGGPNGSSGPNGPNGPARAGGPARANDPVNLALSGTANLNEPAAASGNDSLDTADPTTGKFAVLISLIEHLTGHKIKVIDPSKVRTNSAGDSAAAAAQAAVQAASPAARQGWGISVTSSTTRTESERTTFAASGTVTTTDGREIAFDLGLTMSRQTVEVSEFRLTAGNPAMTDPLVLNFGTGPVALSPQKVDFDLNADGSKERISFVAQGNGFLVLDRNGNGKVDNGSELFGPTSGDGFAELAKFDEDHNGWIDEGDQVFKSLKVWDSADGKLSSLAQHGVGAISVSEVATPFTLEENGQQAGAVRSSGVWLGENGGVGSIHHIDLAV